MPRVLACVEFDSTTETCTAQAWVENPSFSEMLPTVEQAQTIGNAMLIAVMAICAAGLLIPRSYNDEE